MSDNTVSSFSSGRKRGSMKCGLKSKVNVPKGAAAPKPPLKVKISSEQHNELEKVFAALNKSSDADNLLTENAVIRKPGNENLQTNNDEPQRDTQVVAGGNVSKLLKKLQSQEFKYSVHTLPSKPSNLQPVAAPRKTATVKNDFKLSLERVDRNKENGGQHNLGLAVDMFTKVKPKPPSKLLSIPPKPITRPKPVCPTKPTQDKLKVTKLQNTLKTSLEEQSPPNKQYNIAPPPFKNLLAKDNKSENAEELVVNKQYNKPSQPKISFNTDNENRIKDQSITQKQYNKAPTPFKKSFGKNIEITEQATVKKQCNKAPPRFKESTEESKTHDQSTTRKQQNKAPSPFKKSLAKNIDIVDTASLTAQHQYNKAPALFKNPLEANINIESADNATENKHFNNAPSRPTRPGKTPPVTQQNIFQMLVPVLDQCVLETRHDVCAVHDGYEIMPENEHVISDDGPEDSDWSDVSDGEKLYTITHRSSRASSKSSRGSQKKLSCGRKSERGSNKSIAVYSDATNTDTSQKSTSDGEWETDEEINMVDSQGYEDVDNLRRIVNKAANSKQKHSQASNCMQNHSQVSGTLPSDYSEPIPYNGRECEISSATDAYPAFKTKHGKRKSIKQQRSSFHKGESPTLSPKNVPKLPPKNLKNQLSREVPAPSLSRCSYENTQLPKTLPRGKNSLSESNTYCDRPEISRRRMKTDLGFSENSKLSRELGFSRNVKSLRDSSGYLKPVDIPLEEDTPPPPIPPKGLQHCVSETPRSLTESDVTPSRLPVKSRSDTGLVDMVQDDTPPLLPRKNTNRYSLPNTRTLTRAPFPAPLEEEPGRRGSGISMTIPAPRDSLLEGGRSPSVHYIEANPPAPNSNLRPRPTDNDSPPPLAPRGTLQLTVPIRHSSTHSDSETATRTTHSYLQMLEEPDDDSSTPVTPDIDPSLFGEEPLYQIYHCGAVLRDVMENDIDNIDDNDNIYDDAETVRGYVTNILSRVGSESNREMHVAPSSLEHAIGSAGMRTLWTEMQQVKDSGVLETMQPNDRKLQETVFEIMTSEASYMKSLDVLVYQFMAAPPLDICNTLRCVLKRRDHQVLFSNVYRVRSVSKKFLIALERIWKHNSVLDPIEICEVVRQFTQNYFDVYVKYCSNQIYQDRKFVELKKNNCEFCDAVSRIESAQACQGLTLQSFLTLPMQRITRLPLLVDAVCHRMDSTKPNYEQATQCLHTLQKLVKQCNEGARRMENLEQVAQIDRMLEFKNVKRVPVVSHSRSLVKKGALCRILSTTSSGLLDKLKKKKETLHLFLFNDLILITKKKNEDTYQVLDHDARINIQADLISTAKASLYPATNKSLFKMVLLEMKSEYIFAAQSESERMRWVEAVTPVQHQSEHEKIYETWDCPQVQAVHQYTAEQPDELSLEESDVINVHRKMTDGWYEGERIRDGEIGWFPSTHVVEIQSQHVRAKNLRQHYRMLQMSHDEIANMLANPQQAWKA